MHYRMILEMNKLVDPQLKGCGCASNFGPYSSYETSPSIELSKTPFFLISDVDGILDPNAAAGLRSPGL